MIYIQNTLGQKSCEDICNTISKIYIFTGREATSNDGTKAAA